MAAPSPPNPPHPEEKPKQEAGVPIELWGLKFTIPLPKPAVLFLTGLVLLAAAFLVYTKAIQPALANYVVRSKAEWMELRKKAAERDSLLPTVQRDEFEKHFGQSPSATHRAPKEIELDYFDDDGAILFVRTISGLPPVRYWFVDLSKMPLSGPPTVGGQQARSRIAPDVGDSALKAAEMVSNAEGSAPAAAFVTAEGNAVPGRRDWHRQAGANAASATAGSSMHRQVLESTSGAFSVMVWPSQWLLDTALAAMAGWLCSFSVVQQLLQLL